MPLLCRHRQGSGVALDWRGLFLSLWDSAPGRRTETDGGRIGEGGMRRPFKPRLAVLDCSLPPLLFQSLSSSFLSLIFGPPPPSSASFPVKAEVMLLPETSACVCVYCASAVCGFVCPSCLLTTCMASWRWGREDSWDSEWYRLIPFLRARRSPGLHC